MLSIDFKVTVTEPSNVNLNALDRRFETTFSHMSRSTYTGSAIGGHSTENCKPAFSIAERNTLAISDVTPLRSVGS